MRVMIMAAGEGTRLRPLTQNFPKAMAPVVNIPTIERLIDNLKSQELEEIIINLYFGAERIEEHLKDGKRFGVDISYSKEEVLMGTAGGVRNASWFFQDKTFLVTSGDGVTTFNFRDIIKFHKEKGGIATIGLIPVEDVTQYGVVVLNEDQRIVQFQEKPKQEEALSNLVNSGIYVFEPEIFEYIPKDQEYDFGKQVFPDLLKKGIPFYGFKSDAYWNDIGTIDVYRQVHFDILNGKVKLEIPGREISPGLWVEDGVEIFPGAELVPPLVLGRCSQIGPNTKLVGPVVVGRNCKIGKSIKIERSIIWDNTQIDSESNIDESIIGKNCVIESKVTLKPKSVIGSNCIIKSCTSIDEESKIMPNSVIEVKNEIKAKN
jgi:NDP-sugar pyrophosphorylase family protein